MVRRGPVVLAALIALGCRGGVVYLDAGPPDRSDAGMDAGMPPPRMDGAMPPALDGAMPPPRMDGAMPPPPDGAMPPMRDGGMCDRAPSASMRCCYDDGDCGTGPGGMMLRCYGATCAEGGEGQCVPLAPPGRCFGDLDCAIGQACSGGSLGCDSCTAVGCTPPVLGTCG